jgi:hypothetical protein
MSDTIIIRVPDGTDCENIVDRARVGDAINPTGFVVIAEAKRSMRTTLERIVEDINTQYRGKPTVFVGIDYHFGTLQEATELFDTTLAVAPNKKSRIDQLQAYLPGLLRNSHRLGDLGSARMFSIRVEDRSPDGDAVDSALRSHKGKTLHELAEVSFPNFYAYRAPGPFANPAERVLNDLGEVIDRQSTSQGSIQVTSFVFDVNEEARTTQMEALQADREAGPDGAAPDQPEAGQARADQRRSGEDGHPGADRLVYRELGDSPR